ncbi:MAG: sodium:solute symporter [Bacteroidetes bacterium]|nr:MAG: sodium:solute symporter [Bacteroidota bacterium]
MTDYGWLSVLPPVLAIFLALKTKQVYIALIFGIGLGWLILNDWNIIDGTVATIEAFVNVFKSEGNTRTIMFSALVGSLLIFIQKSGGVEGFMKRITKILQKYEEKQSGRSRVVVQIFALLTGISLFVETSISSLTVGTLYRPIFDKLKIPREKLAYIADSISAPSAVLIPFNAWGAFIMGLLLTQGINEPFTTLMSAIVYNFYPILTLIMVFVIIVSKKDFGPMRKAELRTEETGKLMNDNARPMVSESITSTKTKKGIKPKAFNMIIPLFTMVGMMPVMLAFTGWNNVESFDSLGNHIRLAIGQGSGSAAVLYSVITALFIAAVLYRSQKIMKSRELVETGLKGISGLMPLALLMMLAFAISAVCNKLGTGIYIANLSKDWLSPHLLPAVVFLISAFIAFSTGTSWGTFAIMMSIAIPMAEIQNANIYLVIAATLGGGVFGDHCSPISDTTIISSMASASDHIDHVKTQLPYALFIGIITTLLYLGLGYFL